MSSLLPNGKQHFDDNNGRPLVGGRVYYYIPNTSTPKNTWQDEAQTILNTNPIVLDARGECTAWGYGAYRQVVRDPLGNLVWDRLVTDFTQKIDAAMESLAAPDGSSLIGFLQEGDGATPRTLEAKGRDIVGAGDFGLTGVGDETAAVQSAFSASSGKTLFLGINKTYGITSISIPDNVTLVSNGSKFKKLTESSSFAITGGVGLKADLLHLESVGGPADAGVWLDGSGLMVGEIRVESIALDSGASNSLNVGLKIGPDSGVGQRPVVQRSTVKNYCRPMVTQNVKGGVFNLVTFENYKRGLYVKDCQDTVYFGGLATGLSPSATGGPGDNAVLIESTLSDGSSQGLHFYNWRSEDAGEHGYRLGGQIPIRNVWFNDCSAIRPGAASGSTGGCGLKAQGSSGTSMHYNINVSNFIHEDGKPGGGNFCGILYVLVTGGQISNPIIRKRANAVSTYHGLSFLSCDGVQVSNPDVRDCSQFALRLYSAVSQGFPLGNKDVVVRGGVLENQLASTSPVISLEAIDCQFERCGVESSVALRGRVYLDALGVAANYVNCSADFECLDTTGLGGIVTGATDNILMDITTNSANVSTVAANGSVMRARGGKTYFRDAGRWYSTTGSFTVSLTDDTAMSWAAINTSGHLFVTMPSVSYYGQAWMRATATPAAAKIAGAANFAAVATALTGTTGTDGNVTVGATNSTFYLENRSGSTQQITVTVLA
jgi:hypothetical protein